MNETPVLEIFKRDVPVQTILTKDGGSNVVEPRYFWRLRAENGEIYCESRPHTRKSNAVKHAEDAQALMANARIEVIA